MGTLRILRPTAIGALTGGRGNPGWAANTINDPAGDLGDGTTDENLLRGLSNYTGADLATLSFNTAGTASGHIQFDFDATTAIFVLDGAAPVNVAGLPAGFQIATLTFGLFMTSVEDPAEAAMVGITFGGTPIGAPSFVHYSTPPNAADGYQWTQALTTPLSAAAFIAKSLVLTLTNSDAKVFFAVAPTVLTQILPLFDGTYVSSSGSWCFNPTSNHYVFAATCPGEPFVSSSPPVLTLTGVSPRST